MIVAWRKSHAACDRPRQPGQQQQARHDRRQVHEPPRYGAIEARLVSKAGLVHRFEKLHRRDVIGVAGLFSPDQEAAPVIAPQVEQAAGVETRLSPVNARACRSRRARFGRGSRGAGCRSIERQDAAGGSPEVDVEPAGNAQRDDRRQCRAEKDAANASAAGRRR